MAAQREWLEKDYYRVLGVSDTASQKDIRSAYRKLSRQYHPDANPGDKAAEERFKEVSAAYDVVGDPEKRKEYDEVRRLGPMGGMFGGPGAGDAGTGGFRFEDVGDLGDVLGGLFGRARRRGGAGAGGVRGTGPHRGQDLEAELHLSFEDAVHGLTTTVHLTSDAACSTCHGTGARTGTTPRTCPICNGRGVVDDNQGFFSFSSPCPECAGRGYTVDEPCPTCRGSGVERRPREVKVRIPAGVDDGQRIRLRGRGIPGGTRSGRTFRVRGKGVPGRRRTGDLLVTVEVAVPQKLSAEERRVVEALAAVTDGSSPRAHLGVEEATQ